MWLSGRMHIEKQRTIEQRAVASVKAKKTKTKTAVKHRKVHALLFAHSFETITGFGFGLASYLKTKPVSAHRKRPNMLHVKTFASLLRNLSNLPFQTLKTKKSSRSGLIGVFSMHLPRRP